MKRYFPLTLAALCLAPVSFAASPPQSNVFNADLSHPDMAMAVDTFQDVCLPFIMHQTEVPPEDDRQAYIQTLSDKGFDLQETRTQLITISPAKLAWKPPSMSVSDVQGAEKKTFTVYNGVEEVEVQFGATIVENTGEINLRDAQVVTSPAVTGTQIRDIYAHRDAPNLTAHLVWSPIPNHKRPAQSCEITLHQTSLTSLQHKTNLIDKDAHWISKLSERNGYAQCTLQDDEAFLFETSLSGQILSVSVKRNIHWKAEKFVRAHQCELSLD